MKLNKWNLLTAAFLCLGLFYMLNPFLFSWFEIVNNHIARTLFLPINWILVVVFFPLVDYIDIMALIMFIGYILYFGVTIRPNGGEKDVKFARNSLVLLSLIWIIMSPMGITYMDRTMGGYPIGGWSRIILAGGPSEVRRDTSALINSEKQEGETIYELPDSLDGLGYWAKIEREKNIVYVGLGSMFNMADEFGYIIQAEDGPLVIPNYFDDDWYRTWKIFDGIYLFER
ncbi:MAG: hypothetical protein OEZ02_11195 [Anaerolineae bacterium]|nr:hypothetical protein [Anaerolineae bacterium]